MNNKKLSEIKFNKRQIWQVVFTAMTASALMAVDENGQKIVGAIEKEVPELVQQELKEVIEKLRLRQGIMKPIVEEINQEQTMLRQMVEEQATLRMEGMEEIDRINRQERELRLDLERNNRRLEMLQAEWGRMLQVGWRPELEESRTRIQEENIALFHEIDRLRSRQLNLVETRLSLMERLERPSFERQ